MGPAGAPLCRQGGLSPSPTIIRAPALFPPASRPARPVSRYLRVMDREQAPLVCAERGRESPPDAADWKAYLDDDGVAVMFCPECSQREFGGSLEPD